MLIAKLNWTFPRHYSTKDGECYSYLFQNRFKKLSRDLFILIIHNPPASTVSIEANFPKKEEDIPKSVCDTLYRIQGTFAFNFRLRENKLPIIHGNPLDFPGPVPNSIFVNISNKKTPTKNYQYSIDDEQVLYNKAIYFVDNLGPFVKTNTSTPLTIYRNKLIGILPHNTIINRDLVEDNKIIERKQFQIDSDTGIRFLEKVYE